MCRQAPADHEIHSLLRSRWSPRAFTKEPVSHEVILRLLEAARWAPSSNNEQPWAFIVVSGDDQPRFQTALECLVEFNQGWVKHAPLILFTLAHRTFTKDGRANAYAWHDIGLAVAQLTLQATHEGLGVHQLAGIHPELVKQKYQVPDDWQPVSALAIGWPGSPEQLPDALKARETAPRVRKPLKDFVFTEAWGHLAPFLPAKS